MTEECLRRDRAGQPDAERVHPRHGGPGAPAGARGGPRARRRPRSRDRCTACRSRSRTCSTSAARRPPPRRACARVTSPNVTRPAVAHLRQAGAVFIGKTNLHEFAFGTTNEDSAFGPVAEIRTIRRGRPAGRAAGRRQASWPEWPSRPSAPIPAGRSGFRRRRAARSDSSRPTTKYRPTASCRCRARWIM